MNQPIHKQPGKHRWTLEARIPACESPDGNDRTERTCPWCSTVMITVHPAHGLAFRRWRTKAGAEGETRPPCSDEPTQTLREFSEVPFS
jgi:hypothetical protein